MPSPVLATPATLVSALRVNRSRTETIWPCPDSWGALVATEDVLLGAALVLLGFAFSAIWDRYRAWRTEQKERERLVGAVLLEAQENIETCKAILEAANAGHLLGIVSIPPLREQGWLLLMSSWPLLGKDRDLLRLAADLGTLASAVNATIRARESFSVLQMSLSGYPKVLEAFATTLKEKCQSYVKVAEKLETRSKTKVPVK